MHFCAVSWASLLFGVHHASATSLLQTLKADPELRIFSQAVQAVPGIARILDTTSNITVLAPVDAALSGVAKELLESEAFWSYHVLQGMLHSIDIPSGGKDIDWGIIIRTFLTGHKSSSGPQAALVSGWQSVTAIALESRADLYITSGGPLMSRISQADILTEGAVIHKLEKALTLPTNGYHTARQVGLRGFANLILMAGLDEAIGNQPDSTLLIPINEAVEAVAPLLWGRICPALKSIVYRHLIRNATLWTDDLTGSTFQTAYGNDLEVLVDESGDVYMGEAQVLQGSDVPISNGVAHVVSRYVYYPDVGCTAVANRAYRKRSYALKGRVSRKMFDFT